MTSNAENPQRVVSKTVTRTQQPDGSWSVTTSLVFADGTRKEITQHMQATAATSPSIETSGITKSTTVAPLPTQSKVTVPMGSVADSQPRLIHPKAVTAHTLAKVSAILLGFGVILGPIAICLGVAAKTEIAANPGKYHESNIYDANFGIFWGAISTICHLALIITAIAISAN